MLKRQAHALGLTITDLDDVLDYLCQAGDHREIHFLWRPLLRDPHDDMILELAIEAGGATIVTFNLADFEVTRSLAIEAVTPAEMLRRLRNSP